MLTLSIIIVNWNGMGFLPQCLKSIAANPPSVEYDVIVVDNASTDGSREWLSSGEAANIFADPKTLRVIPSDENMGFGRANNRVINETNSQFVFLLNPDTIVRAGAIEALLQSIVSEDVIGAVAPKLLNEDLTVQYNVWGFPPTPASLLVEGLFIDRLLPKDLLKTWIYKRYWDYDESGYVPMFSGAAMMVRRQTIADVGAFDEAFFMYGEDGEWCVRMNRNGWRTKYAHDAVIIHLGGQSSMQQWTSGATRMREQEAFNFFQKKCLPSYLFIANQTTRLFLFLIYWAGALAQGGNRLYWDLMVLQLKSLFQSNRFEKPTS